MTNMKTILSFLTVLLAGCASQNTYMGHKVVDMPFTVAGGKTVSLPITDAGPIPAENQSFKIEVAGFTVGPSKDNPSQAMLTWRFGLTAKSSQTLERVVVEEVAPAAVEKLLVEDHAPALKDKVWSGSSQPIEASKTSTPWLYTDKASIYVFRFTIKARGEPDAVFYQPAWFSKPAKEKFREMIAKINGS